MKKHKYETCKIKLLTVLYKEMRQRNLLDETCKNLVLGSR